MNKKSVGKTLLLSLYVFGMIAIMGTCAGKALAQTEEPPTPTWVVTQIWPGPTKTPVPGTGGCDPNLGTNPEDYDPVFQIYCSHCFPQSTMSIPTTTASFPTPTPAGTLPPLPTCDPNSQSCAPTATPNGTVTPVGTPEPGLFLQPVDGSLIVDGGDAVADCWQHEEIVIQNPNVGEILGIVFDATNTNAASGYFKLMSADSGVSAWGDSSANLLPGTWFTPGDLTASQWDEFIALVPDYTSNYVFNLSGYTGSEMWLAAEYGCWQAGVGTISNIRLLLDGVPVTPTPAVPTVEPGLCSDSSQFERTAEDTVNEILPALYKRDGECLTVIPSLSVIQEIVPDSWDWIQGWTGVQICIRYLGVGVVNFFGEEISYLNFLIAGAAMAIIRRILKG